LEEAKKIEMFFSSTAWLTASSNTTTTITTTTMFSFLKTGDINNTIRSLTNLPGLFTSDGDKIKYALLNHSTAMRTNLSNGAPIFTGIRQWEAEIERRDIASITSGRLPSMAANAAAAVAAAASNKHTSSLFTDSDLRIDNAALAFIMAKELAFLNRTIQMITLIANRYNEEQEDLDWGRSPRCDDDHDHQDHEDGDEDMVSPPCGGEEDLEQGFGDDTVSSSPLQRSHSHPTNQYYSDNGTSSSTPRPIHRSQNQLAATFLIASGRLRRSFTELCDLVESGGWVLVNGMTTMDRPHNEENKKKQLTAQSGVISNIFLHFQKFDAEHRDPVVMAFLQLRDISVYAWKIMSMLAFSNLFRLTEGTEFAVYYRAEDAIFTQGRDYTLRPRYEEAAAVMRFPTSDSTTETEAADVVAQKDAEEEVPSYD
jgi:hypothetical protein